MEDIAGADSPISTVSLILVEKRKVRCAYFTRVPFNLVCPLNLRVSNHADVVLTRQVTVLIVTTFLSVNPAAEATATVKFLLLFVGSRWQRKVDASSALQHRSCNLSSIRDDTGASTLSHPVHLRS